MAITSAIVLYAVIWFMVLFLILPMRLVTQGDAGEIVPGTPAGAPHGAGMARKIKLATVIATVLWAVVAGVILSGAVTIRDIDWLNQLPPEPAADGKGG